MNSIWILLAVGVWLFLGYKIYGRFIEKKLKINDKTVTPAVKQRDDVDFSPSEKPFLVGHHFASIAGAGPIIGPILAISYFGWLPVVLWVSVGSVFIGAMHDFTALMASVRNKAKSVATIARKYLGSRSGMFFGIMILITLLLIITVFSVSAADSIVAKPDLIIPLATITIIAVILGIGVEKYKWNYKLSSVIAIILIFLSVWVAAKLPIDFSLMNQGLLRNIIITVILLYAGVASVIPVWVLLRPRDYLSAIQMLIILLLGLVSIFIVHPVINAPARISGAGFPLWPILFITVACGAISGFHGLVSSGTTSKQLSKESHGRPVGYGSMLLEATLAILVTVVAIAGLKWGVGEGSFQMALDQGWIVLFSSGFGNIVGKVGIPFITVAVASLLGAFMVNQFILTSVDTSTRLSRFIISESLSKRISKKFKSSKLLSRIIITLLILVPAWLLAVTNSYETLWRLFGSSNQLIASITMITAASFFISRKTKVKFILIPALFVLVTTVSALFYLTFRGGGYIAEGNWALVIISLAMAILGIIVAWEGFVKFGRFRKRAGKIKK
jgi:carbon starvation protein